MNDKPKKPETEPAKKPAATPPAKPGVNPAMGKAPTPPVKPTVPPKAEHKKPETKR